MKDKLYQLIEAHKFFCRKSQHYIMGDWNEYQEWFPAEIGYRFNDRKWRYTTGFLPAYIKFLWLSLKDTPTKTDNTTEV